MAALRARHVVGVVALALGLPLVWAATAAPAAAGPASVPIRLGLTGMVTTSAPHGAWTVTIHRGDTIELLAGGVPGVETLAGDVSGDSELNVRVSADASRVPGGGGKRVLDTDKPYRLTVAKAGKFPLHWSVDFLVSHGHGKTGVAATRYYDGTIQVAQISGGSGGSSGSGGTGGTGDTGSGAGGSGAGRTGGKTGSSSDNAGAAVPVGSAPSPTATHVGPRSAVIGPVSTPTISLAPDLGTSAPRRAPALALPMQSTADTYVLTAVGGALLLGLLWLLWVASIKPILGR